MKLCTKCRQTLPFEAFAKDTHRTDGYYWYCKVCMHASRKARRRIKKEQARATASQKTCKACQRTLGAEQFYRDPDRTDGLARLCKDCNAIRMAAWSRTEKGKHLKSSALKRWIERHPEAYKAIARRAQDKYRHTEAGKATRKRVTATYLKTDKGKALQRRREKKYRQTAQGRVVASIKHGNRRALELGAPGTLSYAEWHVILEENNYTCSFCKYYDESRGMTKDYTKKMTKDHLVPISQGGHHSKTNVVPACLSCNKRKHTKPLSLFTFV